MDEYDGPMLLAVPRSSRWPAVRQAFLAGKRCALCGRKENLNAHHTLPFHIDPSRELDPANLIALCEGGPSNCHYLAGHAGKSWFCYVPDPHVSIAELKKAFAAVRAMASEQQLSPGVNMADNLVEGPIQNFFENQIKAYVLSKLDEIVKAIQTGDLSGVQGIITALLDQLKQRTGLTLSQDELLSVLALVVTATKGNTPDILDAAGDLLKKAAAHLRKKPILVGSVSFDDDYESLMSAVEDARVACSPKVAALAEGEAKPEGIGEVIAVVQLVVKLIEFIRKRRQGA